MEKIKNNKLCFIASIITMLLPMLAVLLMWDKLPDTIALHFDFSGTPDGYYSKGFAVFGLFSIILALHLFAALCTACGKQNEGISDKLYCLLLWICPAVSILLGVIIYCIALGIDIDPTFYIMLLMGFLFLILGNYMSKVRTNNYLGLRVKWTLESKKNWEKSNRFSGLVLVIVGIITLIMTLTQLYDSGAVYWMLFVWLGLIFVSSLVMVIYSYLYYKKHKDDEDYFG